MISHPHYYTTYVDWAQAFNCPIYVSKDDQEWLCQKPPTPQTLRLIDGPAAAGEKVLPGVTAIKTGGHFPGSLVLHWGRKLFIADTIVTVPVSTTPSELLPCLVSLVRCLPLITYGVCIYAPSASARSDQLLFPVVGPEHDPSTTIRDTEDLAGH